MIEDAAYVFTYYSVPNDIVTSGMLTTFRKLLVNGRSWISTADIEDGRNFHPLLQAIYNGCRGTFSE